MRIIAGFVQHVALVQYGMSRAEYEVRVSTFRYIPPLGLTGCDGVQLLDPAGRLLQLCLHLIRCSQAFMEWEEGEPGFVKYWLVRDVASRSMSALKAEEGVAQDFIMVTIGAYLATRQVEAYRFKRVPLYLHDDVFSEQFSIRRIGELPKTGNFVESGFQYDQLEDVL
jgi:hypothetical protein